MINEFEMTEYIRCHNNIEYFIENYVKTIHVDKGLINVKLNKFQKEAIQDFYEKSIFCKVTNRQEGKTFLAQCLFLHTVLFQPYRTCAWISYKQMAGNFHISHIVEMFNKLPDFLKINNNILKSNKNRIEFENGSTIISCSSSSDSIKGLTLSFVYIDESDFILDLQELVSKFLPMVASKAGKLFAFTTSKTNEIFSYSSKQFVN